MSNQEGVKALELFNVKAEKLRQSSFMRFLLEQESGITIAWEKGKPIATQTRWPDEEARDAFVLTLRFFVQKRETSSFRKMAKIYESLPISEEKKGLFIKAREQFNEYLGSKSPIQNGSGALTRRHVLSVFLYGELAHANKKLKPIYDRWMSNPLFSVLVNNEFISILGTIASFVGYVRNLNEEVIEELTGKR